MAKETQKDKIVRLENKVSELQDLLNQKIDVIVEMQEKANEAYANSTDKKQLELEVKTLKMLLKSAESGKEHTEKKLSIRDQQIAELKEKLNGVQRLKIEKKHNERGAGRKPKFKDVEIQTMKMLKVQGKSYREIAKEFSCSVGIVYKLINEQ